MLTFSFSDKEVRRTPTILEPIRGRLEQFDINAIHEYVIDATTHLITSKRNIVKGLQALINGKYMVSDDYVDAIIAACTPRELADAASSPLPSPLEEDFDGNWPDATKYLPNPGIEPHPRPAEKFAPDPSRSSIFEGFTFVFGEKSKFEQLRPALTNGGAKTLLFELQFGHTTVDEFVKYVRNVAESKGLEDINDQTTTKGVVVVRFRGKAETEEWALDFLQNVDLALGQRSVEQNEFLDAILQNDARPLKRALEEETQDRPPASTAPALVTRTAEIQAPRESTPALNDAAPPEQATPPSESSKMAPKGKFRRVVTKSRFKGFDDFDVDEPMESWKPVAVSARNPSNGVRATDNSRTEVDSQPLFVGESQSQSQQQDGSAQGEENRAKKRPREVDEPDSAAMLEQLLPGAAAMKKRRLEREAAGEVSVVEASRAQSVDSDSATPRQRSRQSQPEDKKVDVREAVRSHAEKLDAEREGRLGTRDTALADGDLDPDDVANLQNLAIVEEMEVRPRRRPPVSQGRHGATRTRRSETQTGQSHDDHWDDRWNGLKNFKKFRRKGEGGPDVRNRPRRVIIGLEEVKRKDFGLGPDYWLEPSRPGSKKGSQSQSQSQSQSHRNPAPHPVEFEDDDIDMDDDPTPGIPVQSEDPGTRANAQKKGNAAKAGPTGTTSKRKRQTRATARAVDEESSDDDELKFRFRKRR